MSTKIGNKLLIHSMSALLPKNGRDDIWVSFDANSWKVNVNFIFDNVSERESGEWDFLTKEDHAEATLYHWNTSSGMVLPDYHLLGATTNGQNVFMIFICKSVGPVMHFEAQFYLEEQSNELS